MKSRFLDEIWIKITSLPQSPSHDKEHLDRVMRFAKELCETKGGDMETVLAAAMLHDIARVNPQLESKESALVAATQARKILEEVKFPINKIDPVCIAISEHDQPDLKPSTIEAKILKEADFLAGFGAWGIIRTAMFQGERGKSVGNVIERLRMRMPKRINGLEYPESRIVARSEYTFVKLFLSLLDMPPYLPEIATGRYIAFEGVSGSGKDTQAKLLVDYFEAQGREVIQVSEPSRTFRDAVRNAGSKREELFLLLADRHKTAETIINPAISLGKIVIASRCYMSSLVYQAVNEMDIYYILYLHKDLPSPDLILLFDIPAEIAMKRIMERTDQTGQIQGKNERLDKLRKDNEKYFRAAEEFPQTKIINGLMEKDDIAYEIRELVGKL